MVGRPMRTGMLHSKLPSGWLCGLLAALLLVALGCGRRSSSDEGGGGDGASFFGNLQDVVGTVTSQSGTPAQMKSWSVALIERDGGVARVADADANGILRWNKVSFDATQTAVLLSPDYLLQSVMAIPSTKTKTVKQYFNVTSTILPQIVQKGSGLTFQSMNGVTVQDLYASDTDGDGLPDGVGSLGLNLGPWALTNVDTDKDGTVNDSDNDIDGDGLVNVVDTDDDGDGVLDVMDGDANGNSITDSQENIGGPYFTRGSEYFEVKYEQNATTKTLQFIFKLREGYTASAVKIRGAGSLLDGGTAIASDGATGAWDLTLLDDGANFDGAAKDNLYGRKVQLASGKAPRVNQILFGQVTIGTGDSAFTAEFPWIFPNISLSSITTSYDSSSRVVTLNGNPYGADLQGFTWSVSLTNASGLKVYESSAIAGATRTLTIPANVMQSGATYTYSAVAQTLDKVPGMPAIAIRSADATINN
jgi:hypothetical protein